jgi:hypothetical protein
MTASKVVYDGGIKLSDTGLGSAGNEPLITLTSKSIKPFARRPSRLR